MIDLLNAKSNEHAFHDRVEMLKARRWSKEDCNAWYEARDWLCGFNFLPSTSVNFIDMWQAGSFDIATIRRELGWAHDVCFNTMRTNLPFDVWRLDRDGLVERIDRVLDVAQNLGISTMLCLMDDCGFSGDAGKTGPQPAPIAGVHNSRAVASPGRAVVMTRDRWGEVQSYVQDIVARFAKDPRILAWDLYNEPGNLMIFAEDGEHVFDRSLEPYSLQLMVETFDWCRVLEPTQPLTVAGWHVPLAAQSGSQCYDNPIDETAFALSDIISFHAYTDCPTVEAIIARLRTYGRPLLCTEWMARTAGSRIEEQLPLFKSEGIGAWQWGLVNGLTQTHLPWPMIADILSAADLEKGEWFHDLLLSDGTPYRESEVAMICRLAGKCVEPSQ